VSDALRGLDQECPACGRVSGDHTLREWSRCIGATTTDLPFEETPPDMAGEAAEAVRKQFQLDDDLIIADHIVAKAMTLDGHSGLVQVRLPALLHEFQVGIAGQPPTTVAKVVYLGDASTLRQYGRLLRDTANGAANAAERGR
jgi:hypothetical protein